MLPWFSYEPQSACFIVLQYNRGAAFYLNWRSFTVTILPKRDTPFRRNVNLCSSEMRCSVPLKRDVMFRIIVTAAEHEAFYTCSSYRLTGILFIPLILHFTHLIQIQRTHTAKRCLPSFFSFIPCLICMLTGFRYAHNSFNLRFLLSLNQTVADFPSPGPDFSQKSTWTVRKSIFVNEKIATFSENW